MAPESFDSAAGTWLGLKDAARALDMPRRAVERRVLKGKLRGRFVAGEIQVLVGGEGHARGSTADDMETDAPPSAEPAVVAATQALDEDMTLAGPDAPTMPERHDEPHAPAVDEEPPGSGADEEPAQYTAQQAERSLAMVDAVSQLVGMQVQPLIAEIRALYERNEILARENGQLQERVRQAEQRLADAESRADTEPPADTVRVPIPPDIERTSAIAERLRQAAGFAVANEAQQESQADPNVDQPPQLASQDEQADAVASPTRALAADEQADTVAAPSGVLTAEVPLAAEADDADSTRETYEATARAETQTQVADVAPSAPGASDALSNNGLHSPSGQLDAPLPASAVAEGSTASEDAAATAPEESGALASAEGDVPQAHQDDDAGAFTPSWWATVSTVAVGGPVAKSAASPVERPAPSEAVSTETSELPGDAAADGSPTAIVHLTANEGAATPAVEPVSRSGDEPTVGADAVSQEATAVGARLAPSTASRAAPDVVAARRRRWWLFWLRA